MKNKFNCPLPFNSVSFDAGGVRRLCCHDISSQLGGGLSEVEIGEIREKIKNGEVPKNCSYCVYLEKLSGASPRLEYVEMFGEIVEQKKIKLLDITFENTCNLACYTCSPSYSSSVEVKFKALNIPFKKTLAVKEYLNNLKNFELDEDAMIVITGGEPTLLKSVKKYLTDLMIEGLSEKINIRIFSNVSTNIEWFVRLSTKFKSVNVVMSLDAVDELAEYIRPPARWVDIEKNVKKLIKESRLRKNLTISVNSVLSVLNFFELDKLVKRLLLYSEELELIPEITILDQPKVFNLKNFPKQLAAEYIDCVLDELTKVKRTLSSNVAIARLDKIIKLLNNIEFSTVHLYPELVIMLKRMDEGRVNSNRVLPYIK